MRAQIKKVRNLCVFVAVTLALSQVASAQGVDQERARTAGLVSQILRLEEEIRRLTGRVEEAEFAQRRTNERIERLIGDVDLRLRLLEGESLPGDAVDESAGVTIVRPDGAADTATGPTIAPLPSTTANNVASDVSNESAASANADQEGVLGTIPRDALLGLERPGNAQGNTAAPVVRGDAETRYQAITSLLAESDTASARPALQSFLNDFPDAPQASQASFMLGETWFLDAQYADAAAQFAENYRSFGDTDARAPDNLLKLGMSLSRLGDADRACTAFIEFERRYPQANTALQQMAQRESRTANCP